MKVQTSFVVLQTVTEMQNGVEMTSKTVYFRSVSLFGNHSTKIHYKFHENTALSRKMLQNIIKQTTLAI